MPISLDEKVVYKLSHIISKYSVYGKGIEIQFGKFKGLFVNEISKKYYDIILKFLGEKAEVTKKDYVYNTTFFENFDIDITILNLRFQLVRDENILHQGLTYDFRIKNKNFIFRLTEYNNVYKLSILFYSSPNGKLDIKEVFEPVKFILSRISKSRYIISYQERKYVTSNYNNLLKKNGKNPIIIFNKPYNLKRENFPLLLENNFLVFPKLDGVRYFMYVTEGFVYLINYTEFIKIGEIDESLNETIIDGELIENKFYPFDLLFYRSRDFRHKTRLERIDIIQEFHNEINQKGENENIPKGENGLQLGRAPGLSLGNDHVVVFKVVPNAFWLDPGRPL